MKGRFLPTSPASSDRLPGNVVFLDVVSRLYKAKGELSRNSRVWRLATMIRQSSHSSDIGRQKQIVCEKKDTLWKSIESMQRERVPLWIFASDAGVACELSGLWDRLESGEYSITGTEPNSQAAPMQGERSFKGLVAAGSDIWFSILRGRKGTVRIVDIRNYCNYSLHEIADMIGMSLEELPGDDCHEEEWIKYSLSRCRVVCSAIGRLFGLWEVAHGGTWQTTVASMSMTSYRRCRDDGLPIVDTHSLTKDLERNAYYAGRVWVRKAGEVRNRVHKVDSRSFYGFIMSRHKYPCRLVKHWDSVHPVQLDMELDKYAGCAEVYIDSPNDEYPVRTLSGTAYCTGRFWTTLAGPELERASRACHIKKVGEVALYETADLFSNWARSWWEWRSLMECQGKRLEAAFVKRLIVSLYGKWSQMSQTWEPDPATPADRPWSEFYSMNLDNGEIQEYRSIGWSTHVRTGQRHKERTFPAISAFIASYGREYMRQLIRSLPSKSCYYSAVDSVIVNDDGLEWMQANGYIDPDRLGGFRVEETADRLIVHGPQHYQIGNRVVLSGIDYSATSTDGTHYIAYREYPHVMQKPGRPDGIVAAERVELTIPYRAIPEVIGQDGWTLPISLALAAFVQRHVDVQGLKRVPTSLHQAAAGLPIVGDRHSQLSD